MISDPSTAVAALQTGEIDWVEQVPPDLVQALRQSRRLRVEPIGQHDNYGALRLNHLNRRSTTKLFVRRSGRLSTSQPSCKH